MKRSTSVRDVGDRQRGRERTEEAVIGRVKRSKEVVRVQGVLFCGRGRDVSVGVVSKNRRSHVQ